MPQINNPFLLRDYIGRELAKLREKAGLSQVQAAKLMNVGRSTIARIEAGDESVVLRDYFVATYLDRLAAPAADRAVLIGMAMETQPNGDAPWWHNYTQTALPGWFRMFVLLEDAARLIRHYEPELIPGLLQTRGYAEQVYQAAAVLQTGGDSVQRRVDVRLDRQSLLDRPNAPRLDVILGESALRRPLGGSGLMARQLKQLLVASERHNVSVRVLPYTAGAHAALGASFILFDFPEGPKDEPLRPQTAYTDTLAGAIYTTTPAEVDVYQAAWDDLGKRALDETASSGLINTIREEYLREVRSTTQRGDVAEVHAL